MKPLSPGAGSICLAAVAGFVDTLGFVGLFGLFTAHVTGNFVLIGAELVQPGRGVALKLLAFPAFVLAVAMSRGLVLSLSASKTSVQRMLLGSQGLLLLCFMLAGLRSAAPGPHSETWTYAAGLLGAAAMGLQNGCNRMLFAKLTPNTVMTGNVTQLVIDVTDWLVGRRDAALRSRISSLFFPVLAFALGSMGGAIGYVRLGFAALLFPSLLIALLAVATVQSDLS